MCNTLLIQSVFKHYWNYTDDEVRARNMSKWQTEKKPATDLTGEIRALFISRTVSFCSHIKPQHTDGHIFASKFSTIWSLDQFKYVFMCKRGTGSFERGKTWRKFIICSQQRIQFAYRCYQDFSLNSWITASFRCQDTKMGQRHCKMTCSYLKDVEVKAANTRALVLRQVTPDVPGSHSISDFPLQLKEQVGFCTRGLTTMLWVCFVGFFYLFILG